MRVLPCHGNHVRDISLNLDRLNGGRVFFQPIGFALVKRAERIKVWVYDKDFISDLLRVIFEHRQDHFLKFCIIGQKRLY